MRHRKFRFKMSPFLPVWWQSALKAWEITLVAPQVIAHRTKRIASTRRFPGVRDRREFTRMGQEKVEAFGESLSAMTTQLYRSNLELALRVARQWVSAWPAAASLLASGSPTQIAKAQSTLLRGMTSVITDKRLSISFDRLVQKGLRPIHSRVTGNAKRLGRVKKR